MKFDKTLFDRFKVVASPSQLVDYLDCPRKWWFRRVRRIKPDENQSKFLFGTALHGVIERHLAADDTGRDQSGKAVDLYPAGWNAGLSRKETQLIQMLARKMIDDGIVRRLPGRQIEFPFELHGAPGVGIIGALDVVSPEGVEDHKTTKDRKWASTAKDLASDPKMLCYAKVWFDLYPDESACILRLNYATKNEKRPEVWPVHVAVLRPDVEKFWNETVLPSTEGMLSLRTSKLSDDDWKKVAGPCTPGACEKYGGCAYARVCGRMTTPAKLRAELEKLSANAPKPDSRPKEKKPMSIFGKNKKSAAKPPADAPVTATKIEPEQSEQAVETPPWHSPGCVACKEHPGLSSKGDACRACNARSAREGRPTSDAFDWGLDAEGDLWWQPKDGLAAKATAQVTEPVKSTPAPRGALKTGTPATTAAPDPMAGEEVQEEQEPVDEPPVEKRRPGRPPGAKNKKTLRRQAAAEQALEQRVQEAAQALVSPPEAEEAEEESSKPPAVRDGFVLYINSIPFGEDVLDLAQILEFEGNELAASLGAESFYLIDAFRRRDMLASKVAEVAKELAGKNVVAIGGGQDLKTYLEALRPYAERVVVGVF